MPPLGERAEFGLCVGQSKKDAWGKAWYLNHSCTPRQCVAGTRRLLQPRAPFPTASSTAIISASPHAVSRSGSAEHACG